MKRWIAVLCALCSALLVMTNARATVTYELMSDGGSAPRFASHDKQEPLTLSYPGTRRSSLLSRASEKNASEQSWLLSHEDCNQLSLIVTLRSEHFEAHKYNQDNAGIGFTYRKCGWTEGRYVMATYVHRNSLRGKTFVVGMGYEFARFNVGEYSIRFGQEVNALDYYVPEKCKTFAGIGEKCQQPFSVQGALPMNVLSIGKENEWSFTVRQLVPTKPILLFSFGVRIW